MERNKKGKEGPQTVRSESFTQAALTAMFKHSIFKRIFVFILSLTLFLFGTLASAMESTVPFLLMPKMKGINTLELGTATFHKSSGTATTIQKVTLTYFTSVNCSSGPFIPAFSTPDASPEITIPGSGNVSLNASSTYAVAVNGTPGTTNGVNSVLVGLGNNNGTFATFTGSCASTGGNCCLPITCDTGTQTCTASVGVQNFTLNTTGPSATISTSSPLLIQPSTVGSLVITNTGPATATNIVATLPSSLGDITQDSSNCLSVASGATCQLSFTASSTLHDPTLISIKGDNTNTVFATLSVAVPWVTNGIVYAMAQDPVHHLTYIGGAFTVVGPNTPYGVPIDTASAQPLAAFPKVNGIVSAVIPDGSGGWYIGGSFTNVGGVTRNRIAHILSDYTVDPAWNPNVNGTVNAIAISGSTVYVGGNFATVNSPAISRNRLAAFNNTDGTATNWNPNANGVVNALAISGSTVYVGGNFGTVNSPAISRNRLAAFNNTDGTVTSWNPNANGSVNALAISGSTVYVGGGFTTVNSSTFRTRLAAFNNTDGTVTNWNPNASGTVYALAISGSTVYAGGDFSSVNSPTTITRNRLAAFNDTNGTVTSWNPNASGTVYALAISGSTVYAGGSFTILGGKTRTRLAAFNNTDGTVTNWNPNASGSVYALAISGSTVYAGGDFTTVNSPAITRNRLAAFNNSDGTAAAWNPNVNGTVNALAISGSTVYAGGNFTTVNSSTFRNRLAAFNNTDGTATDWNPNVSNIVYALAISGSTVYAGGGFTTVNNGATGRSRLAAFNNTDGTATDWNPSANNVVNALAISGSTVYAGGGFTTVNSSTFRTRLAAFNNTDGTATNWNPNANGSVSALAINGSTVYAGGLFTTIGNFPFYAFAIITQ